MIILPRNRQTARPGFLSVLLTSSSRRAGHGRNPRLPGNRRLFWVIVAVMALTILPGNRGLIRLIGLARDRAAINAELAGMEEKRIVLEKELRQLATDQATIDRLIREELGWVRRNETVYYLPDK